MALLGASALAPAPSMAQSAAPTSLQPPAQTEPQAQPRPRTHPPAPTLDPRGQTVPSATATQQPDLGTAIGNATSGTAIERALDGAATPPSGTPGEIQANTPQEPAGPPLSAMVDPRAEQNSAPVAVTLTARLTSEGNPIPRDVVWHIYHAGANRLSEGDLVASSVGGPIQADLPSGTYVVHVGYGRASITRPVTVGSDPLDVDIVLDAGGLRLTGAIGENAPLPADQVIFEIYAKGTQGEEGQRLILADAKEDHIIPLPAGTYHIISRYGDANAVVRANITVQAGQLTDAVIYHKAAFMTLKLVNEPGGEALANTAWTILTPGGETIREIAGAFPSLVLAEGDYTAIALHNGQLYNRDFSVQPGFDREVELVAK